MDICRVIAIAKKNKGIFFMLISVVSFAVVNTFVKLLNNYPAHELIFFRSLISLTLCVITLKRLQLPLLGNNKKWLLVRGISGVTALTMFFITLQNISMANAVTIQYLSPLFTSVLAIFILKEKVKPLQWFFFALAFCGVFLIKGFDESIDWKYLLLGIGSALFAGLAYNAVRKCKDTEHPLQVVLYFPLVATPIMGIACLYEWTTPVGIEWLYILIIGFLTQVAQVNMTKALHADKAAKVTPFKYFGAIFAIVIGYTIFDEQLILLNFVGIALIILGVLFNSFIKS